MRIWTGSTLDTALTLSLNNSPNAFQELPSKLTKQRFKFEQRVENQSAPIAVDVRKVFIILETRFELIL